MKDRVPTQVVNGAVRMEQLDADGNSLGYIYLRRADEPSEAGTPYNKNSVLTDETASALGLDVASNPTPNDAFAKVASVMRTRTVFETIYSETFEESLSIKRTLDTDLFKYERLLVCYTYKSTLSSGTAYVDVKVGSHVIGTDGFSEMTSGSGMIYFDNSSPIKLCSGSIPGYLMAMVNYIRPKYIYDTGVGNEFYISSNKSSVLITGFTIYGERAVLENQ